jgi:hypothetical protein
VNPGDAGGELGVLVLYEGMHGLASIDRHCHVVTSAADSPTVTIRHATYP